MNHFRRLLSTLALLLLLLPIAAQAQATRTWVSGVGDDANPCSRTAPCKTFAGAISKTAPGGAIDVLDPGGFGAVTITKSITIESENFEAGVLTSGTNGIIINAGVTDTVVLRGLQFQGLGTSLSAINVLQVGQLVVDRSVFEAFNNDGITFGVPNAGTLVVRNCIFRTMGNAAGKAAINIIPTATGSVGYTLDSLTISGSRNGIAVSGPAFGHLRDSTITSSVDNGVLVTGGSGAAEIGLENTSIVDGTANGVNATGSGAIIRLGHSTLSGNAQGIIASSNGQVVSFGDNRNVGNVSNGAPTGTIAPQ